jgi:hypothetical protein
MATEATTIRRTDAVLDAVETAWRTTSYLDGKLYDRGFTWGPKDTRTTLHALHGAGQVKRQRAGSGYRWRKAESEGLAGSPVHAADMTPLPVAASDALLGLSVQITRLAEQLAQPAVRPYDPEAVVIGTDAALGTLVTANHDLVARIVKRAVYQAGKALLDVLDGWIEGAVSNNEAMGRRDAADPELFHAADIRTMVNDAMRLMGAPEHRIPQGGE